MPYKPKAPCPVCRRLGCTDPTHSKSRQSRPRPSRQYDHTFRKQRDSMVREWVWQYGWVCPGAAELDHPPHAVRFGHLDVDHIDGDRENNDPANLRVLCRRINRGKARMARQHKRGAVEEF